MKSVASNIHKWALRFITILSLLIIGILFLSTFVFSYYAEDMITQIALPHIDNLVCNIIVILFAGFLAYQIHMLSATTLNTFRNVLLILVPAMLVLGGFILILWGRTLPAADAYSVYAIAEAFAKNDFSAIQPTGDTYLSFYPQQMGLIAYYEVVCRIWNLLPLNAPAYHIIKCGNVLFACLVVIYQYRSIHLLTNDIKADIIYLLFACLNVPLFFYTSFVYGEIPSFAFICAGIFYLLLAEKKAANNNSYYLPLLLSLLLLALAVMLRKNSLIIIIAIVLATLCHCLHTKRYSFAIYSLFLMGIAVNILPSIQCFYELRANNTLLDGVPAMSYFAMGMQEAERGNGWYNGFNFYTYQALDLDNAATIAASKQAITERLAFFNQNKGYATKFYTEKFLSQWTDGSYACRQATLQTFAPRPYIMQAIYDGNLSSLFSFICNSHQLLIYAGAFGYLIWGRKKAESEWTLLLYMGFIAVIGGLLFHTLWEANSRYILPYGFLLVPYAAMGFAGIQPQKK